MSFFVLIKRMKLLIQAKTSLKASFHFLMRLLDLPLCAAIFGSSKVQRKWQGNHCHQFKVFKVTYQVAKRLPPYRALIPMSLQMVMKSSQISIKNLLGSISRCLKRRLRFSIGQCVLNKMNKSNINSS